MLEVSDVFACPMCHGPLANQEKSGLRCSNGHDFPVIESVPDLAPLEIRRSHDWRVWSEHLKAFDRRRQARLSQPERVAVRWSDKSKVHQTFGAFIELAGDRVLDIGCGPGRFRRRLPARTRYIGIDPLPILPDVGQFDFARGVSEYLPLGDNTVSDVVILAALDHFKDLDRSFQEIHRVLVPKGRLHVMQSVHLKADFLREIAHRVKDWLEDKSDDKRLSDVPHHMTEFTPATLSATFDKYFTPVRTKELIRTRFAPRKLMITVEK